MNLLPHRWRRSGFTLVEMLVSLAVLAVILTVLAQANSALSNAVRETTSKVRAFQAARDAFEAMTRRISQATLNAYDDTAANTSLTVTGYSRASELRFICGPASLNATALNGQSGPIFPATAANIYHPTHAIFFQAPLGKFSAAPGAANLVQMLNTCGYYIEWNNDTTTGLGIVPAFIPATYAPRYRYRLMETVEPSDQLTIYKDTSGSVKGTDGLNYISMSWGYNGKDWYTAPAANAAYQHAVADNIVLLAFLPMVSPQTATNPTGGNPDGTSLDLAPNYIYDSAPPASGTPPVTMNQLPPMIFVEMIAVDESSFNTYQLRRGNAAGVPTNLGVDSSTSSTLLTDATYTTRQADIATVTNALQAANIKYRVFTTIVPLTAH